MVGSGWRWLARFMKDLHQRIGDCLRVGRCCFFFVADTTVSTLSGIAATAAAAATPSSVPFREEAAPKAEFLWKGDVEKLPSKRRQKLQIGRPVLFTPLVDCAACAAAKVAHFSVLVIVVGKTKVGQPPAKPRAAS